MVEIRDCLSILGVNASASTAELKAAYRREIVQWHPDRFFCEPAQIPAATEHAKLINAAYELLSELHELGHLPLSAHRWSETPAHAWQAHGNYRTQHSYNRKAFTPGFPDPSVFEVFVKSSHIISTGYNRNTRTLYIKFDGNSVYSYLNVPESVFSAFISAESHGKFAHCHIYHKYKNVRHSEWSGIRAVESGEA